MSGPGGFPRPRRGSLGARPKLVGRFFKRRSTSVTEQMIRSVVDKMNLGGKDSGSNKSFEVYATLPDGSRRTLTGENGMRVNDLVADVVMEYKLTSYRVHMTSTRAILNLDADALLIDGDEIIIDDGSDGINNDPRTESDTRLRIVYKLLRTEKLYQEALRSIFEIYAEPLRKFSSLTKEDHRVLFFGLEPLLSLSAMLCLKIEDSIQKWDSTTTVCNLFSKQFWHHYEEYHTNYKQIRTLLREKRDSDEEFVQFCKLRRGAARHSLESLLLLPVQRLPSYATYLSELIHETDPTHPDYEELTKAAARVKTMVKEREQELSVVENEHKVESVQERFPNDDLGLNDKEKYTKMKALHSRRRSAPGAMILRTLSKKQGSGGSHGVSSVLPDLANSNGSRGGATSVSRVYVLEGPAQLTAGLQTQERYLFLFNDLLLIAKQKSSTTFKLKYRIRVCEMWTATCLDDVSEMTRAPERSFVIGWPTSNVVATFSTTETKDLWFTKLKEQISAEKEKEQPKTLILKVLNHDMDGCPTSKSLTVTNYDEAQEAVKRCLEEFGITEGDPQDYQLWVVSGKEDSPYPLIGHEQPYSIKMSHVRDAARGTGDEMVLPIDVDANDNSIQCQFILRQTKKEPHKHSLDEGGSNKKSKKNKKSPLLNLLKKKNKSETPPAPVVPTGKLFGHSLCELFEEDAIPKPIMDMLLYLFTNGPYTTGIFRKSANQRVCKELRERLDREEDVSLEDEHVTVVAVTFKDFLRSLPDCVLRSDMFDNWMDILDIPEDKQRVDKVKKNLEQLPKPHVNLLSHVICMLYYIDQQRDKNQMNSYNLAICIGQSLLYPHPSSGTPQQTDTKKVPQFIQFLIDHAVDIFGEDVLLLLGEPPEDKPRQDSSTDSDSMHSMLSLPDQHGMNRRDDSSIDSLERDYIEMESSPRLFKSTNNLSRDSGLTLSDTQLYNDDSSEADQGTVGSPRKNSYSRSVSQMEEGNPKTEPAVFSRSFDGLLDNMDRHRTPVAPPRKNRRRGPEPLPTHDQLTGRGQNIRVSNSTGHIPPLHHMRLPKCDSLGSLEEYTEGTDLEKFSELQEAMNTGEQILRKSESGGRLFVNDQLVAMHIKRDGPSKQDIVGYSQQQRDLRHHSWGDVVDCESPMSVSSDLSASYGGMAGSPMGSPGAGLSSSYPNLVPDVMFSVSPPESPLSESSHGVPRRPHSPPPYSVAVATTASCQSVDSAISSADSLEEPVPPRPPRPANLGLPHLQQLPASPGPESSMSHGISHPKGILRHPLDLQRDLRKVHKGMTSTGADFFPKYMRSVMRHSLQEGDMHRVTRDPLVKQQSADSGFHQPDSPAPSRQTIMTQMRQIRAVEKSSPSESRTTEFPSQQAHSVDRQKGGSVERRRPDKPPSYQEAIQRKSLLQNGALYSEQELVEQRLNSDRARQLYEESMRKYMEQQPDKTEVSVPDISQRDLDCSSHRAPATSEERVSSVSSVQEKQVEKVSRPQAQSVQHSASSSVATSRQPSDHIKSHDHRQSHDPNSQMTKGHNNRNSSGHGHERTTQKSVHNNCKNDKRVSEGGHDCVQKPQKRDSDSRDNTPVRKNSHERSTSRDNRSNNASSERPKSRSKSRDKRHGHRSSDTRLENSRSQEDREFRNLRSNLIRSKSDSHDHLNKIGKFKELKPLDSNIIEQYKRAKLEWNLSQDVMSNEEPKRRIQSVKHRDWHRELAEQYNQIFYQPTSPGQPKSPQYAYVKSNKQEANENERPKRRWTPPVHPSKDLVIRNEGDRPRKNTPPRTVVKSENDFRNGQQYENSRKTAAAEKENRPAPTAVPMQTDTQTVPNSGESDNTRDAFTLANSKELSWSVAHLRNLYDENKNETESSNPHFYCPGKEGQRPPPPPYRHPPPVSRQGDSSTRRSAKEKTNPDAEESYV